MAETAPLASSFDKRAIAGALGLSARAVEMRAAKQAWSYTEETGRGGRRRLYAMSALPADVQAALALKSQPAQATRRPAGAEVNALWTRYNNAPDNLKKTAAQRLRALRAVESMTAAGQPIGAAREMVAAQLRSEGVEAISPRSIARWSSDVVDHAPNDWLAALLPGYAGRTAHAPCDEQCWDWYKGHYLTRARPSHRDTYLRLQEMAKEQGWTIPSARTLERRIDAEVSQATQAVLRDGPEAARRLLPTMQRDALVFEVGEAVNGDGLKFDRIWVKFEDGEILNTATAWIWQDVHSRRILAWRVAKTENTDLFRLATYDLTAQCAPTHATIDNTVVAANKLMTAGVKGRHRFRSDPEDGMGLLLMLGIDTHFTNPSRESGNPGAKPIERAFGIGGLHELVATNPELIAAGGFSKATAIPVELLRKVLADEVRRFNRKPQRRTQACRGVLSFDDAWAAGMQRRPPRVLAETQRQLLLMSREVVRADQKNGELRIEAGRGPFGRNAYWCEYLLQHRGQKLAVHFDPENLAAGVHVYSLDGRYLFAAEHIARGGFNDTERGREHSKFRRRIAKRNKDNAADASRMDAIERSALYALASPSADPPSAAADTNVVQGHFSRVPNPSRDAHRTGTDDSRHASLGSLLEFQQRQQLEDDGWMPPTAP